MRRRRTYYGKRILYVTTTEIVYPHRTDTFTDARWSNGRRAESVVVIIRGPISGAVYSRGTIEFEGGKTEEVWIHREAGERVTV